MGLSIKKAIKKISRPVKNLVKSSAKAVETAVSGTAKLATGDVSGALDKYGRTITNAANVASMGSVDLTGGNEGILNINTPKYANAVLGKMPQESASGSSSSSTSTGSGRMELRAGKGLLGGGSTYLKAKYPLGGSVKQVGK